MTAKQVIEAGKGKVELEIETIGDVALSIINGLIPEGTFTMSSKGTVTIYYDVTQDTWFFAFPVVETSSGVKAYGKRAPAAEGALKIYSIKVTPGEYIPTGIKDVRTDSAGNGYIYNVLGQRVNMMKKGIYVIDGRKFVVK